MCSRTGDLRASAGAWLAQADRGDAYHALCREFFRHNREPLMTTYPALVEYMRQMFKRLGVAKTGGWMATPRRRQALG